jgi:D-ornithine 4,5-aminomutase subunit alpha
MERAMERPDDYQMRRVHLKDLTEDQLEDRFWELTEKLMNPVVKLAETHTSPSIERSVLLRMGFSSLESTAIVQQVLDHGLIGKGAGHIVYQTAKTNSIDIREAGLQLAEGQLWNQIDILFEKDAIPLASEVRATGRSPQRGEQI